MIWVVYASKHGATEGIARFIAERLRAAGREVEVRPAADAEGLGAPEAVVIGSALYAGSWMKEAVGFAHRHVEVLFEVPVWLFSSGPLGEQVEDEDEQPRQLPELEEALSPRDHRVFFGALDRSKLGFAERMMVKAVKAEDGDFRDWDAIGAWADEIAAALP